MNHQSDVPYSTLGKKKEEKGKKELITTVDFEDVEILG